MSKKNDYTKNTQLIYGNNESIQWNFSDHLVPPMTKSSTFRLHTAERGAKAFSQFGQADYDEQLYSYERFGEPNKNMLEENLAIAEGGESCITFASGMSAVHAATSFALNPNGNEIISHRTIYGCSYSLFTNLYKNLGIKVSFCDLTTPSSFLDLVTDKTRILYLEAPANPTLDLLDLDEISKLVKEINKIRNEENRIITVIDNTFATPWSQRPIEHGIEVVLHSLTKNISGFGTCLGGAVITKKDHYSSLALFRKDTGGSLSPNVAWQILVYGLPTLGLRITKQIATSMKVAKFLEDHPKVDKVLYPGLESFPQHDLAKRMLKDPNGNFAPGFLLYFTLKADSNEEAQDKGRILMNKIAKEAYCITLAVSLGQLKTLIEHPSSMTHSAYSTEEQIEIGIHPGGIRLAIGIEEPEDLIKDLEEALK